MTKNKWMLPLIIGLGCVLLLLWFLEPETQAIAKVENVPFAWHVSINGLDVTECGSEINPCRTIQYAIDKAQAGDSVLVAAGVYSDVQQRNAITQVVYIDKDITLRGGYTTTDWTTDGLNSNPTILDAKGRGRVVYITGVNTRVTSLHITGGNGAGLRGEARGGDSDAGGGVYSFGATVTISNCEIFSNTGSTSNRANGGGIYIWNSSFTLINNEILSNTASTVGGEGGGVFITSGSADISHNTIVGNFASRGSGAGGGGITIVFGSNTSLNHNLIMSNTASLNGDGVGGGVYVYDAPAILTGNLIQGNIGSASSTNGGLGGGINIQGNSVILDDNTVINNVAAKDLSVGGQGGGLWVYGCNTIQLTNNVIAGDHANTQGSELWFGGECRQANLIHNTIADSKGIGQGIFVAEATLALSNTILSGHSTIGIQVSEGNTATLQATLWNGNGIDYCGAGMVMTGTINLFGDPSFVNPDMGDYHIHSGSAAIDSGVEAGVYKDIDGNRRPLGLGYEIGADEWMPPICFLPFVLR